MITEDYKQRIQDAIDRFYPDENKELLMKACEDYASAKGVKVMSGYMYAQPLFKEFWETYDTPTGSMAIEVLHLADEELPF